MNICKNNKAHLSILILASVLSFGPSFQAKAALTTKHKHSKGHKVNVKVHGMVCDFCATAIKKRFMKQKEVKDVSVDLDNMTITIEHMPGKILTEKKIKKQVEKSGYKYKHIIKPQDPTKNE